MKKSIIAAICLSSLGLSAQIKTPQPSPAAKITQTVGLTEVTIEYSRPHRRDRVIFGELVPFDKTWRTGANKNAIITIDDMLIFGKDTLNKGSYAIFTEPKKETWNIFFYSDTENWGTPEKWDDKLVAAKARVRASNSEKLTESFTISIDNVTINGGELSFAWEKTKVSIPFTVATETRVMAAIDAVINGPKAEDYYTAGDYYFSQKKDLKTALEYVNKALEMKDIKPFWYLRKKALILAELKDFKGAIAAAKLSLAAAKTAEYESYIISNEASIQEWTKLLK